MGFEDIPGSHERIYQGFLRKMETVDGMAEINKQLEALDKGAPAAAAQALYKGAGIMAAVS